MAWSPHDPSLLLSAGKDARTICWDVSSAGGDIVCEYPASNPANWAFDVAWCPGVWLGTRGHLYRCVRGCDGIGKNHLFKVCQRVWWVGAQ